MERSIKDQAATEEEWLIEEIRCLTQRLEQSDCDKDELARLLEEALNRYTLSRKASNSI